MSPAWLLTDGHAGNLGQAQALAQALGVAGTPWTLQARPPWRWLAPSWLPGARHAFGHAFAQALSTPPALAIGCGRQGALATRLARAAGARAVQILDPRLAPAHWDLVIAPEHDRLAGSNVIAMLGSLNPVDDAWLAQARTDFAQLGTLPGPRTALLLGGPSAHAAVDEAAFGRLAQRLDAVLLREGGSLLATTSRRTLPEVAAQLAARFPSLPGPRWRGPQDGPNLYPGLLAWADRIVCTADSVNMLSEACATGLPVYVFEAERVTGRPRRLLDALLACGRIRPFDGTGLPAWPVQPLRETARVAAEVARRIAMPRAASA